MQTSYVGCIYWHGELDKPCKRMFARIHLILPRTQVTLADLEEAKAKLKEIFSHVSSDEIFCGKIHKSSDPEIEEFYVISCGGYFPREGNYPGWKQVKNQPTTYSW